MEPSLNPDGSIVSPLEVERFVEGLEKIPLEEVGSTKWMRQHAVMEKLNLQAHQSAQSNSDEYILEHILLHNKLEMLVHDLITIEAWKQNVYPHLLPRLAGKNTIRTYFILYHEATVINLLECFLFHRHVCAAAADQMVDLTDYCARKLTRLNGGYDFRQIDPNTGGNDGMKLTGGSGAEGDDEEEKRKLAKERAEKLSNRSPTEELRDHLTEIEFRVCISSVACIRFVIEHADALPLNVVSRVTDTHDMLLLIIPLIENPPWIRRTDDGTWQKIIEQVDPPSLDVHVHSSALNRTQSYLLAHPHLSNPIHIYLH
jgi:hypothetical protein